MIDLINTLGATQSNGVSPELIVALAAVIVGPLVAFIATSRKLSGKIETSEAGSLWTESKNIREDYRQRLAESDQRIARLEQRVAEAESRNNQLTQQNMRLTIRNSENEKTIDGLRKRIKKLEEENVSLKAEIAILREHENGK